MSKSTQKSRVLDMTDGNIARLLLSFAFPIFVGCVLQQVYTSPILRLPGIYSVTMH